MKREQIQAPKGVSEYVPPRSASFEWVRDQLISPAKSAGYQLMELPVFEDTNLFSRGVGESTDVVSKEMYTFEDRGGRSITLRPEGTAGVMRAVIEHSLDRGQLPVKVFYSGAFFRAERPQAGRYRQFYQVGVESIGLDDPAIDAEIIALADKAFKNIGLKTLMAIDNWDHLTGKSVYPIKPDFFTVMGTNDVKHAVAIHDCDPKSILPFGLPRFDVYRTPINSPAKSNITTKKKILYCGFSLAHSEKRIVDQIANFMDDKYGEGAVEVCYRPHPGPLARYDNYEIRNERVDITKHGNLDRTAMPDMDQKFIDVLMSSDVVVGAPTTLLLEAMLLGKTCVLDVTLDGFHRTTAGNSARRHTHMLDLLAVTSLPRGKSVTELIYTIDSSLQNSMNYKNYEISHLYNVSDKPFDIQLLGFLTRNAEPLNAIG